MATPEENKATVRRAVDAFNRRDRAAFDPCYAPVLLVRTREGEEDLSIDHDQHWEAAESWFAVEMQEEILQMLAEGYWVMLRSRYRAVHNRALRGMEPTGRPLEWEAWQLLRLEDGRICEEIGLYDEVALLRQLGVPLPTKG